MVYYMVNNTRRYWWFGSPQLSLSLVVGCLLAFGIVQLNISWRLILQPASRYNQAYNTPAIQKAPAPPPNAPVDCATTPCIALTFDDGPNPVTTPRILDILDAYHVPATFFVVGSRVPGQEQILRRMYTSGHEIGSHSWNHPDLTTLSPGQVMQQVNMTQSAVIAAGVPAPSLFRPPYGAVNPSVKTTIPMTLAMWNIDPLDWETKDPIKVRDMIVSHARPGGVVDLHDIYPVTAESLSMTIEALRPQYQFVTFSQMFDLYSGQRGEYFGR